MPYDRELFIVIVCLCLLGTLIVLGNRRNRRWHNAEISKLYWYNAELSKTPKSSKGPPLPVAALLIGLIIAAAWTLFYPMQLRWMLVVQGAVMAYVSIDWRHRPWLHRMLVLLAVILVCVGVACEVAVRNLA